MGIFGDGGANTGRTWESVNLASVWKLPLIIVCENNMYAVETQTALLTGGGSIARRAEGFGLPVRSVDGQDVAAMYRATAEASAAGGGRGRAHLHRGVDLPLRGAQHGPGDQLPDHRRGARVA